MNGAESLVHTLVDGGVDVCFANPGTSEMHFVAALDRVAGMPPILALFEGVVTGAADGFARMAHHHRGHHSRFEQKVTNICAAAVRQANAEVSTQ